MCVSVRTQVALRAAAGERAVDDDRLRRRRR